MKKKTRRVLPVVVALMMLCGCAGESPAIAQLPAIQSSQVLLPDFSQIPSNEDLPFEESREPVPATQTVASQKPASTPASATQPEKQPTASDVTPEKPAVPATGNNTSSDNAAGNGDTTAPTPPATTPPVTTPPVTTPPAQSEPSGDSQNGSGSAPATGETLSVRSGGTVVSGDAYDIICRVVMNEVGGTYGKEAIKAMAVASYSYIKYYNVYLGTSPTLSLSSNAISTAVANAVTEVLGQAVYYNGRYANCTYFAVSAGCTTSAQSVWGTSQYPYLVSVDSSVDTAYSTGWSSYQSTKTFTAAEFAQKMNAALGTTLDPADGSDPAGWIEIVSRTDGLYVGSVRVGDKTTTGRALREQILGLRSHAFDVRYDAASGSFTFTVYGYGHGVGMSQVGANFYAQQGWNYQQILTHYYSGTTVS